MSVWEQIGNLTQVIISIGLFIFVAIFLITFVRPKTRIKKENLVIKILWKKTIIPISEITKLSGVDMLRQGYQVTIFTKNRMTYYTYGVNIEEFGKKLQKVNPHILLEEKAM